MKPVSFSAKDTRWYTVEFLLCRGHTFGWTLTDPISEEVDSLARGLLKGADIAIKEDQKLAVHYLVAGSGSNKELRLRIDWRIELN